MNGPMLHILSGHDQGREAMGLTSLQLKRLVKVWVVMSQRQQNHSCASITRQNENAYQPLDLNFQTIYKKDIVSRGNGEVNIKYRIPDNAEINIIKMKHREEEWGKAR